MKPNIQAFLEDKFEASRIYQTGRGIQFSLTFDQYIALWGKRRLATLARWADEGTLLSRMKNPDYGYTLNWTSRAARDAGVMDASTARIVHRAAGRAEFSWQRGDKHSAEAKARIASTLTGYRQETDHVAKRAAAQRGVKRGPMSQAHKDAISAARREKKA
jgi:hypothetical protein